MRKLIFVFLLSLCGVIGAYAQSPPIDTAATAETRNLLAHLQLLAKEGVMFGHQDDLAYGIGWGYEEGRSDVKAVVGEYPAIVGWDLGHLELGNNVNLDSVPFKRMVAYVQKVYAMGGLSTFSWHLNNPLDPNKTSWDKEGNTIRNLFTDKESLARYELWLERLAKFMNELKGPKGEAIPVIFRPFHEHTGSWFWWGEDHSSPEEYKRLWRFTVDYLRRIGVHNLLYAYSTGDFYAKEEFLKKYPGDDYVDIIGFDNYHRPGPDKPQDTFVANSRQMVETIKEIGEERGKVWALTETGLEQLPQADWWTKVLLPIVKDAGLSYVLVWRNARPDHFYAPYPGHESAENFKAFYNHPNILFLKEVAEKSIYKPVSEKKRRATVTKEKRKK